MTGDLLEIGVAVDVGFISTNSTSANSSGLNSVFTSPTGVILFPDFLLLLLFFVFIIL